MDYKYNLSQFHRIVSNIDLTSSVKLWIKLSDIVDRAMQDWNNNHDWILDPATMTVYVSRSSNGLKVLVQDKFAPTIKIRCYIRRADI